MMFLKNKQINIDLLIDESYTAIACEIKVASATVVVTLKLHITTIKLIIFWS